MAAKADLRNLIILLANGEPSKVVGQIDCEIEEVQSLAMKVPVEGQEKEFGPFATFEELDAVIKTPEGSNIQLPAWVVDIIKKLNKQRDSADKIAGPLSVTETSIQQIESKPGIKRYNNLQKEIQKPDCQTSARTQYRREIQSLKASYSKELSDLGTKIHEALAGRLNLIQCWKNVIVLEIDFYENLRSVLLEKLRIDAAQAGDEDLFNAVHERLKSLQSQSSSFQASKISQSTLQLSNVKVLKETLRQQLNEIIRIDRVISQKQEIISHIDTIEDGINAKINQTSSSSPSIARASETKSTPSAPSQRAQPSSRMTFSKDSKGR